ncbi:RND family efflux transporter, MFP subunit [Loktanella sp. DSM 29012]|uniref:Efflux RND transporter periplasmic adaptor subunit n=1 Tax=Loktanella gaetbuli TaxID=2881335 RepID=A0ABS8BX38_9RHOB|nr:MULTISPECIES: efflux RND transporter periplasmic adaptor subunit [Loktanella]MCB5200086.1 efflux RND transporter periplasmic adaptor subunit [Loktanella gaetbuli]SEP78058.1 RND family efflux transporter, MFP subunit [Loktanella sp. DSM 29012]
MLRIATVLFALAAAAPLSAQEAEALTPSGDPAPMRAVKLIRAAGESVLTDRTFFGQVVALETVDLSFEVGGQMTMFDAQEGQFLQKDVQIAALDVGPFERAVERAQINLTQAERALSRAETLAATNAVSATQAEDAQTARDLAAVALREAEDALADASLHAPFEALVASRLTPNFAIVSPGQPIVRLHDMSEVRVEIDVPERLFQNVDEGSDLKFTGSSPLFAAPVPLELREFNAETQNIGQSYRVTLALTQDDVPPAIIPGASITVTATLPLGDESLVMLPPSAVSYDNGSPRVLVYTPNPGGTDGTVAWQPVEVGSPNGTDLLVSGIAGDTQIVAAGLQMLTEGETVRPFIGLTVE